MRMRKRRLLSGPLCASLLVLTFLSLQALAQTTAPNEWTWMGGSDTVPGSGHGQNAVYGTLGTPAAGNTPGGILAAPNWTDQNGNLWLSVGFSYDSSGGALGLDDLWKFDPTINEWARIKGSSPVFCSNSANWCGKQGVYGTLGTPAAANSPGTRFDAVSWTDSQGKFWLFGGQGYDGASVIGRLNDLWKFDPSSNEWAWESGGSKIDFTFLGQSGVYGTLGVPAAGNIPGRRFEAMGWADSNGNLWLFGGQGNDIAANYVSLNDLWEFNPSSSQWTWMGGSSYVNPTIGGLPGVYGTLGVPSTGNLPGSRYKAVTWTDSRGHFWLFGGMGFDSASKESELNDLWEFDPSSKEWTWISGVSITPCVTLICGQPGIYGTLGTPATGNIPGGRRAASSWIDSNGNLWLFGGIGLDASAEYGMLDDLWTFNPSTKEWAWMGGNNGTTGCVIYDPSSLNIAYCGGWPGVYGTLGTLATGNLPGSRQSASSWTDNSGNLWLFGGGGYDINDTIGSLNDLWKFQPSTSALPPAITPIFSVPSGSYSGGGPLTISNGMANAGLYYTTDGSTPNSSSALYSGYVTVSHSETVKAIAKATGYPDSAVASATYVITPVVAAPTFSPAAGTYTSAQTVTISDTTANATIYYTTNGTTPTTSSTVYNGPITVSSTETIKTLATATGYTNSAVATAVYTINIPPDFSVAASPASFTVTAGQSGTATIAVTPLNGFNSAVTFACSGLPTGASCSFSPATVTPSGAAASTTLTVATSKTSAALHRIPIPWFPGSTLAALFCCLGYKKRRLFPMLLLAASLAGLGLLNGCGGGGSSAGGSSTPQSTTSTVTVTASSGTLQHTATFTLTVN
jgi:N-acetylneuraminic acid mutarotase